MEQSLPHADIIVLIAIVAFIFLRYRNMLGTKKGHDFSNPAQRQRPSEIIQRAERQQQNRAEAETPSPTKEEDIKYAAFADTLQKMRTIDPSFHTGDFLSGARTAFEMVIDAFSKNKRDQLKSLLAPDVYREFTANLDALQKDGKRAETTLIALTEADIVRIELTGTKAQITVRFMSEQVQVVRDKDGNIVEGNASQTQMVEDEWVFERDLKSRNPNWNILDT